MARRRRKRFHPPGTQPGTLAAHAEAGDAPVRITSFRYDANRCEDRTVAPSEIPTLSPPEGGVLWLDVCGLSDPSVVRAIGDRPVSFSIATASKMKCQAVRKGGADMGSSLTAKMKSGTVNPPVAELVGFKMLSHGNGEARFEMEAGTKHHNPMGTVHGGILCTLADSAMGMAFASTLDDGETFTTLEVKINYLRPVFDGKLFADAKVLHRGRSVGVVECDVTTENGKLVARAVSTCSVLRGENAEGR